MTNEANKWIKQALVDLKRSLGGQCTFRGCREKRLSKLEFAHIRKTPIVDERPRKKAGRKERYYDIKNHPEAYRLRCRKHNPRGKKK